VQIVLKLEMAYELPTTKTRGAFAMRKSILLSSFSLLTIFASAGCSGDVDTPAVCTPSSFGKVPISILAPAQLSMDLLLSIDNSRSMADKQAILALTIPDLIKSLVNPPCLDGLTGLPSPNQPASPLDVCPDIGSQRRMEPVTDLHIGVITSSLGGHGADSCPDVQQDIPQCAPTANLTNNDHGRLVARLDPCTQSPAPTYQNKGFLAWDPEAALSPPGESVIDDGNGKGLTPALRDMVLGTGQIGCGYESQLESIYRFLADPNPYETISIVSGKATPMGIDQALLAQRAEFLRPDSLLAILMLTDENDCSIKEYGYFYYVGQLRNGATNVRMPRARKICETDPNDPCCKSCGQADGSCPADPTCANPNGGPALLTAEEDDVNLRCWDQKRRFGIDFLYPTDRYVDAFRNAEISDNAGNVLPNPIFSDLLDQKRPIRDPGLVMFAGIVGVPWQALARDVTNPKLGFKNASELATPDQNGLTTWDKILGDLSGHVKPADPIMYESIKPRAGTDTAINGGERTIPFNDDLQYACIFPLLPGSERDCSDPNLSGCDCQAADNDNPLCAPNPNNGNARTLQVNAKAYPSLRQLEVIKRLDYQGIVTSACPVQVNDKSYEAKDFGYRPAFEGILDRLTVQADGYCPSPSAPVDANGQAICAVIEMTTSQNGQCNCDPSHGRVPVDPARDCFTKALLADERAVAGGWDCACEIPQLSGAEGDACRNDVANAPVVSGVPVSGYCYIDTTLATPIGNPELVAQCPDYDKREFRFVGDGRPRPHSGISIICEGSNYY
jgi:hypothetical protein